MATNSTPRNSATEIIDTDALFGFWLCRPVGFLLDRLIERMDPHGMAKACACSTCGVLYDFVEGNDETLAVCRDRTRLSGDM